MLTSSEYALGCLSSIAVIKLVHVAEVIECCIVQAQMIVDQLVFLEVLCWIWGSHSHSEEFLSSGT
jgi:hypothetical protein